MRVLLLPSLILCGFYGVVANAAPNMDSEISVVQQQINLLPALNQGQNTSNQVDIYPVTLKTVDTMPQFQAGTIKPEVYVENENAKSFLNSKPTPAVVAPPKSIASLSPKTKGLIDNVAQGIGSDTSKPGKIVIKAGGFDNTTVDEPEIGEFEEVGEDKSSATPFDVEVSTKQPAFNDHEVLRKAEKALRYEQFESAIALYMSALEKNEKNRDAMLGLGAAYQKMGRKNRAKEVYAQILEQDPKYEPALNNLLVLAASEAPERALEEFAEIEAKSPDFAGVYAQKAKIYRQQLNLDYAVNNLRRALEIEPDNNVYRYDLAILEDERGGYAAAAELYSELVTAANAGKTIPADKDLIADRMNYISSL